MRLDSPKGIVWDRDTIFAFLGAVFLVTVALVLSVIEVGTWLTTGTWPVNPLLELFNLLGGRHSWGWGHIAAAVVVGGLFAVAVRRLQLWMRQRRARAVDIDRKAPLMGSAEPVSLEKVTAKAAQVGVPVTVTPGFRYAKAVTGDVDVWLDVEASFCAFMGVRRGKTRKIAVRAVAEAPGGLVALTSRRDLVDKTLGICEARGQAFVFDPTRICNYEQGGRPAFWWNPLRDLIEATEAETLADLWANANADPNAQKSQFFDSRGPTLLGGMLLAAACEGLQIPAVFRWVANPEDWEPVDLLYRHGHGEYAIFLKGIYQSKGTEKTGLFSTAANAVKFMIDRRVLQWITDDGAIDPRTGRPRPELIVHDFVRSDRDALYLLSKKGKGTAAPLTAALTTAVTRAAEEYATEFEYGRLRIPFYVVGDEIATVWRWPEVPDKLAYYGGTGIILFAIFQSYQQAVTAYGKEGAKTLLDTCTARVVGGGMIDTDFYKSITEIIGRHWSFRRSVQTGKGTSSTDQPDKELILDVDELSSLRDRVVLLPAAARPILGYLVDYSEMPYAAQIDASEAKYSPKTKPKTKVKTP